MNNLRLNEYHYIFRYELKHKKWFWSIYLKLFLISLLPLNVFNFKNRFNLHKEIFIRYFNKTFNTNIFIEQDDFFEYFYNKYIVLKIKKIIFIMYLILLPIGIFLFYSVLINIV